MKWIVILLLFITVVENNIIRAQNSLFNKTEFEILIDKIAQDTDFVVIEVIDEIIRNKILSGAFKIQDYIDYAMKHGGIYFDYCNVGNDVERIQNARLYFKLGCLNQMSLERLKKKYDNIYERYDIILRMSEILNSKYSNLLNKIKQNVYEKLKS